MPRISLPLDAGAIEVVDATRPDAIDLRIRADSHAAFLQWFSFGVHAEPGAPLVLRFLNAGECTYVEGWKGYQACASYDGQHWFRVPTEFDGQVMTVRFTPHQATTWLAYFEPYPEARRHALLGRLATLPGVRVDSVGFSVEGRSLDRVRLDPEGAADADLPQVWIIARQHPGESMAEWFCEGLLERLTDRSDPVGRRCRQLARFSVVPNMNPDGSVRGNLRTNAAGANLNREWMSPDLQRSPEVWHVREAMHATGVDLCLDVHGDEGLPYVFVEGPEQLPSFSATQAARLSAFLQRFLVASPDFQVQHGYPRSHDTKANLTLASKYVSHTFGALSMTLEMPFKDNALLPDATYGWDGARSRQLGAAALLPILGDLQDLHASGV